MIRKPTRCEVTLCALMVIAALCGARTTVKDGEDSARKAARLTAKLDGHVHAYEHWFGLAAVPSGETHRADHETFTTFQMDAGNDDFGDFVQIMGSADTPHVAGNNFYDLHEIFVENVQQFNSTHQMQIAFGATTATAIAENTLLEIVFRPTGAASTEVSVEVIGKRHDAGTKAWARVWADGQASGTVDILFGITESVE